MSNKIFAGCDSAGLFDLYQHTENKEAFLLSLCQFRDMKTKNLKIQRAQKHAKHFLKITSKKAMGSSAQIATSWIESDSEYIYERDVAFKKYLGIVMRHFMLDDVDDYWVLFIGSKDKKKLVSEISMFATHDFGPRSSQMMDYQQAAMQWLKDFVEKGCKEPSDVF